MAKLTGKKKAEFLARMAKGRKKAERKNPKKATRKNPKKAKRKNPISKYTVTSGGKTFHVTAASKAQAERQVARALRGRKSQVNGRKKKKAATPVRSNSPRKKSSSAIARRKRGRNPDDMTAAERKFEEFHGKPASRIIDYSQDFEYRSEFAEIGKLKELRFMLDEYNPEFPLTSFGACQAVCTPDGRNIYFIGGDQSVDLAALDIASDKDIVELGACCYIRYHTIKGFHHDFEPMDYYHTFREEDGIMPVLMYDRLNRSLFLASGNYQVKTGRDHQLREDGFTLWRSLTKNSAAPPTPGGTPQVRGPARPRGKAVNTWQKTEHERPRRGRPRTRYPS